MTHSQAGNRSAQEEMGVALFIVSIVLCGGLLVDVTGEPPNPSTGPTFPNPQPPNPQPPPPPRPQTPTPYPAPPP